METKKEVQSNDDRIEVTFDGLDDQENVAAKMSLAHKFYIALILSLTAFCITTTSSIWSLAIPSIKKHFHVGQEVATLGITFYIFGLAAGGIFLSPVSERYGRKLVYLVSLFFCCCFQLLSSFSNNYGSIMFGRFASSFFGSAFLSVCSGTFSDIYSADEIFYPYQMYVVTPFVAPAIGSLLSGFICEYGDFRWCFHTCLIFTGAMYLLVIFTIPETYKPYLLVLKAKRLRKQHNSDKYYAPIELEDMSIARNILTSCKRPVSLFFRDPMMACLCFYTGYALAIVYMFFICLPYVFSHVYHFSISQQGLGFLGMCAGPLLSVPIMIYLQKQYEKNVAANNGVKVPEMLFLPLKYGVFLMPAGLMIIAWTSYKQVHWMGVICGSAVFGISICLIFSGIWNYTVDGYRKYAASALSANVFVRCFMSGIFPLFGLYAYKGMGINWASFMIAMVAIVMIPIPFVFTKYGAYLRSKSPYAWSETDSDTDTDAEKK